jgi:hypothetical protein
MIYKNAELYNVEELLEPEDNEGKCFTRIPENLRTSLNASAMRAALRTAGCEIRFNLKSDRARIVLQIAEQNTINNAGIVEIYQGNFLSGWNCIGREKTEIEISLPGNLDTLKKIGREKEMPFDTGLTRIVLPFAPQIKLISLEGEFSPPEKGQVPTKKLLAYGSSITHGAECIIPSGSYAMRTAYLLGSDLINLGFGGGAHLEKQMADYIAERNDWDFASMEMGINMIRNFDIEEFRKRVEYFIPRISQANKNKWIFCIDLFLFYMDFEQKEEKEKAFREIIKNTVEKLNLPKLVYIDGREILKSAAGLKIDLVHPSPAGMQEMAYNLAAIMKKLMD